MKEVMNRKIMFFFSIKATDRVTLTHSSFLVSLLIKFSFVVYDSTMPHKNGSFSVNNTVFLCNVVYVQYYAT